MKSDQIKNRNARYSRSTSAYTNRPTRPQSSFSRSQPNSHSAQTNYERYLALAQAEALSGNAIGAENYHQHAEHYFRIMSSDK